MTRTLETNSKNYSGEGVTQHLYWNNDTVMSYWREQLCDRGWDWEENGVPVPR